MSDHRTIPTPLRDDESGRSSLYVDAALNVRVALSEAFRPGDPLDVGDVAAAAALLTAAEYLSDRGWWEAAALLDVDARPGRAVDSRTADHRVRAALAERFGIAFVPVIGGAR